MSYDGLVFGLALGVPAYLISLAAKRPNLRDVRGLEDVLPPPFDIFYARLRGRPNPYGERANPHHELHMGLSGLENATKRIMSGLNQERREKLLSDLLGVLRRYQPDAQQ